MQAKKNGELTTSALNTNPVYAGMPIGEAKQIMKEYLAYAINPEFRAEIRL